MERLRLWIQTLAFATLATALLIMALRPQQDAQAAEPPKCTAMYTDRLAAYKASEDVGAQAVAALTASTARDHVAVVPVITSNGSTLGSILCTW